MIDRFVTLTSGDDPAVLSVEVVPCRVRDDRSGSQRDFPGHAGRDFDVAERAWFPDVDLRGHLEDGFRRLLIVGTPIGRADLEVRLEPWRHTHDDVTRLVPLAWIHIHDDATPTLHAHDQVSLSEPAARPAPREAATGEARTRTAGRGDVAPAPPRATRRGGDVEQDEQGITVIEGAHLDPVAVVPGEDEGTVKVTDMEAATLPGGRFRTRFSFSHASTRNDDRAFRFVSCGYEAVFVNTLDRARLVVEVAAFIDRRHLELDVVKNRPVVPSSLDGNLPHATVLEVFWDGGAGGPLRDDAQWIKIGENRERISHLLLEQRVDYDTGEQALAHPALPAAHVNRVVTTRPVPDGGWLRLRITALSGVSLTIDDMTIRAEGELDGVIQSVTIRPE